MVKIEYLGSNIIENQPFKIDRPEGSYRYIFFHFVSKVMIEIDGQIIEANPGSCILYEPNIKQKFYVNNNRLNHDYIDFIVEDESFLKKIKFPLNTVIYPKMSVEISSTINKMKEELNSDTIGSKYILDSLFSILMVNISRKLHVKRDYQKKSYSHELKSKFEKIRLDMYDSPDNLEVSKLAESLGFSLSHFNYLYKEYFSVTPIKDLTAARLQRVNELIQNGIPTKEIIKTIGFTSDEYFYRWFKKHNKLTKSEYVKIKNQ